VPYPTNESLPERVKKRLSSAKARRMWRHVWTSVRASTGDEGRAYAAANSRTRGYKEAMQRKLK
jgi:cation transport regulator ChaB